MVDIRIRSDAKFVIKLHEYMARLYATYDSLGLNDELLASWVTKEKAVSWFDPNLGYYTYTYPIGMKEAFDLVRKQKMVWFKGKRGRG